MTRSRRSIRTTLRAVIPLLAIVWASLPLHQCNLASAAAGKVDTTLGARADGSQQPAVAPAHHCHQLPAEDRAAPSELPVRCGDLGRGAPDLRPSFVFDVALAHVTWDAGWLDRGLRPLRLSGLPRPFDDGHWRIRPLHLQKAVLLI